MFFVFFFFMKSVEMQEKYLSTLKNHFYLMKKVKNKSGEMYQNIIINTDMDDRNVNKLCNK